MLVPNLPELAALTGGGAPELFGTIAGRARDLADGGAVVVTLGERGALVLDSDGATHIPAPQVDAIDTTGAGDAFCGSLAAQLARCYVLVDAARDAVQVAGTRNDALRSPGGVSIPRRDPGGAGPTERRMMILAVGEQGPSMHVDPLPRLNRVRSRRSGFASPSPPSPIASHWGHHAWVSTANPSERGAVPR